MAEPDPFADYAKLSRHELMCGDFTDDELANAVFMSPNIVNTTGAKERIRWLSRKLTDDPRLTDDPLVLIEHLKTMTFDAEKADTAFNQLVKLAIGAANLAGHEITIDIKHNALKIAGENK